MTLRPGEEFGSYEILAAIGRGGMGEVYSARDRKLQRSVALKVLPDRFEGDPDRLARFQREAEVLASLSHPAIAAIFGLEEDAGRKALVLELVDGPTLADRVARGAVPVDEALSIARQIATALEAAHERGVIHRDLKPSNIKVTDDGTVKVLDFGLAKLAQPAQPGSAVDLSQSPTLTSPALATNAGVILGTAAYMSPEQAKGKPVDRRSDMWAFGCVLYEMLTGRRAFLGEDVSETLAEVLKTEPAWKALPPGTPESIRRLLRRCLAKDRNERLPDAAAARLEIDDAKVAPPLAPTVVPSRRLAWVASCILASGRQSPSQPGAHAMAERLTHLRLDSRFNCRPITLYPVPRHFRFRCLANGRQVAFVAGRNDASQQVWLRRLARLEPMPLRGTEGAGAPFFFTRWAFAWVS